MSKQITPVSFKNAPANSKPLLEAVQKSYGMIPNLIGNLANHPESLKSYLALSESFAASGFSALEQQIVAITVSTENGCTYCVAAHSAISAMSKLDEKVIGRLRSGEALEDRKLEALRNFTRRVVSSRGWLDQSDVKAFFEAGYTTENVLAVILGVTMKTLSNYVNHFAKTELDGAFKPFAWSK